MKAKRKILSLILAAGLVVTLFQAIAFAAPETISGTFTIDTENTMSDPSTPDNPDAPQVAVPAADIYTVDEDAGTVTVRPGAKITLSRDASDYRIIVSGNGTPVPGTEDGDGTVEITLDGFTCDRTKNAESGSGSTSGGQGTGGSGTGDGTQTGGGQSGTGDGTQTGDDNSGSTGTGDENQGGNTGDQSDPGTTVAARAGESGGSAIALQNGASVILYLEGTNGVIGGTGAAAIEVPEGTSLTIAEKGGSSNSRLTVTASGVDTATRGSGAAIGGGAGANSGTITINSGTIIATADGNGAAIGGGAGGTNAGGITINDGMVTATAEGDGAAIGGGMSGNTGTIRIANGTVKATANGNGAAIGGGASRGGGVVMIEDGMVTATATKNGAAIGGGSAGNGAAVTVNGGEVTAKGNIGGGKGATIQGSLIVNGSSTKISVDRLIGASTRISEDGAAVSAVLDEDILVPDRQTMTVPIGMTLEIPSGNTLRIEGRLEVYGNIVGTGTLDCEWAEDNGVVGEEKISKDTLKYIPPCEHDYLTTQEAYHTYNYDVHVRYCEKCKKPRYDEHRFSEGRCLDCMQREDAPYIFTEEDKTLTVYKNFGGPDINTPEWAEIVQKAEEIVIVEGVQYIAENAFINFENVKHIYVPESTEGINANTFPANTKSKLTVYCPYKWSETINATEDTASKFVFYETQGEGESALAVIEQITDAGVEIPETIYGRPVYLADGVLKEFPDVKHEHRIPEGVEDGIETSDSRRHYYTCAVCGTDIKEKHRGGEATCVDKAICEVCGDEYGTLNRSNHVHLVAVEAKMPTHLEEGNIFHYYCEDCDRFFADSAGEERIRERSTILKALSEEHTPEQTEWLRDAVEHWHTCACGELIDVKPHSFVWVVDREATETENGLRHQRCSVCGYEAAPEEIPRTSVLVNTNPSDGNNNGGSNNDGNNNNNNNNGNNGTNGNNNGSTGGNNTGTNGGTSGGTNGGTNTGTSTGTQAGAGGNTNTTTGIGNAVKTGDYVSLIPWIALLLVSGAGVVGAVVYYRKKAKKNEK